MAKFSKISMLISDPHAYSPPCLVLRGLVCVWCSILERLGTFLHHSLPCYSLTAGCLTHVVRLCPLVVLVMWCPGHRTDRSMIRQGMHALPCSKQQSCAALLTCYSHTKELLPTGHPECRSSCLVICGTAHKANSGICKTCCSVCLHPLMCCLGSMCLFSPSVSSLCCVNLGIDLPAMDADRKIACH